MRWYSWLIVAILSASPASAQPDPDDAWCKNEKEAYAHNLVIGGCTRLLAKATDPEVRADVLIYRALENRRFGLTALAIADLDAALLLNPQEAGGYGLRGEIFIGLNADRARRDLDRAIKLDPKDFSFYENRGDLFHDEGDYTSALSDINHAIKLKPDRAQLYVDRAKYKSDLDLPSVADARRAIALGLKTSPAYYELAYGYYKMGDLKNALAAAITAMNLDPSDPSAYTLRGIIYTDEHDYTQAFDFLNISFNLDRSAVGYLNLSAAYENLGNHERAIYYIDQAILHDPNLKNAYTIRIAEYAAMHVVPPEVPKRKYGRGAIDFAVVTKSVVSCYTTGKQTVQSMYDCSGQWLTPRAFLFCVLDAGCPSYPDTVAGRENLAAMLGPAQLATKLVIDPVNLPKLPTRQDISGCGTPNDTEDAFLLCTLGTMGNGKAGSANIILDCVSARDPQDVAKCLAAQTQNPQIIGLVDCMHGKPQTPESISSCLGSPVVAQLKVTKDCLSAAGELVVHCIVPDLPADQAEVADCISKNGHDEAKAIDCLAPLNPSVGAAISDARCAAKAASAAEAAGCLVPHVGGDAAKVAKCIAGKQEDMVACLAGDRPEYQAAAKVYACVANGRDASSFVDNCAGEFIKDEKTRKAISCVAEANGNRDQLAACAAGSLLPPEVARYASCAATSDGPTSFALCAAAPMMNEEWRIAAECAVESGGNPVGWAGCTAGTLTVRELTKCFQGEIGKDCFGENNTLRKTLDNEFADITRGPGESNEIVKAIELIGKASGGPNSIVNNPEQLLGGPNSILHNPGQIAGGPNSFVNQVLHPPLPSLPPLYVAGILVDPDPSHPSITIGGKKFPVNLDPTKFFLMGTALGSNASSRIRARQPSPWADRRAAHISPEQEIRPPLRVGASVLWEPHSARNMYPLGEEYHQGGF